jgi:ribosomal protein S18 acetylase RimI-like enzyme
MIRKLKKGDREQIKSILIATEHFSDEEIEIALELIDVYLNNKDQKDYNIHIYESDDTHEAAGYVCFGKRPLTAGAYDLYWIAVDPDIHGKGIGSELVKFMEKSLKEMRANLVLIETSGQGNYRGERAFYEKNGYRVQTVIRNFYKEGDDLVIYHKYLN